MSPLNQTLSEEQVDLDGFSQRLIAERDRLRNFLGVVTGHLVLPDSAHESHEDKHQDEASDKMRRRLKMVSKALGLIEVGHFGFCIACSGRIPNSCLDRDPAMLHCYKCSLEGHSV